MTANPIALFSEPTQAWFTSTFAEATAPQAQGWPAIAAGDHTLICAPTGTGKTLAAFLWAIDRLVAVGPEAVRTGESVRAGEHSRFVGGGAEKAGEGDRLVAVGSEVARTGESVRAGERSGFVGGGAEKACEGTLGQADLGVLKQAGDSGGVVGGGTEKAIEGTLRQEGGGAVRHGKTKKRPKKNANGRGGTRVLYVSPLRALAVDVEKNLRAPLLGIRFAAERLSLSVHEPTVGVRTGDTPSAERRRLIRHPPDILITTPESLFLMLTSKARETLSGLQHVIIDEIHAVAGSKRGTHLTVSLERLDELCDQTPQRIGLSATQRPLDEIAHFLGGYEPMPDQTLRRRPVTVVEADVGKILQVEVVVPVDDMSSLGETVVEPLSGPAAAPPMRRSIWPAIHPRLLELVKSHHSTLIFANARRLSERLAARLNELHFEQSSNPDDLNDEIRTSSATQPTSPESSVSPASVAAPTSPVSAAGAASLVNTADEQVGTGAPEGTELVKAHHGSISRKRRLLIEDELKRGELKGLVATSTLELGIDMGAVDLVVQVASPGSVASGMQRIGRAGHQVGEPSHGKIFPKHRADLLEAAAVVERMHQGQVEHTRFLRNPLDVAAQQIVAMCAMDDWPVDSLAAVLRRCAGFRDLSDEVLHSVLDLLSGNYPAEEFSELRPRVAWDRAAGVLRGRAGAQRLAVTNAGTIPDRGLFGVFLPDGTRVGELDEEMVYESRVGETFLLGASTWRIVDITFERVIVTPAPGELGKMPFWHGDGPGRPLELGRAVGRLVRELRDEADPAARLARLQDRHGLDATAADNLVAYLNDQAEATGAVPDDRTVVVERFRDEIGDWRVCMLTPFGARVHAPWGMALQSRLGEAWGGPVDLMWSDDGIVMRLPEAIDEIDLDDLVFDPEEIRGLVIERLPETSMFASRFRECAARALLLPRRRPGQRTPLWQQRQRAADLLRVAAKYPSFPIMLEATRECVNDVFDLPALAEVMSGLRSRQIRMIAADTSSASPFAQSLLFSWIAVHMYEGDAPLAERRAAALALDPSLLRDLLGDEELRELLDPAVLAAVEMELQRLAEGFQARDADEAHDLLRLLGPLSSEDLVARSVCGTQAKTANARVGVAVADRDSMAADAEAGNARVGVVGTRDGVVADTRFEVVGARDGVAVDAGTTEARDGVVPACDGVAVDVGIAEARDGVAGIVGGWMRQLIGERRVIEVRLAGRNVFADVADAARLRDAVGVALPPGLPATATQPVSDPLGDLCVRYARTHGPFVTSDVSRWLGVSESRCATRLTEFVSDGRLVQSQFHRAGTEPEFCDAEVLRRIRRRCLAVLRREVEPVEPEALACFLPSWQGVGSRRRGVNGLAEVISQLQGAAVAASVLEADLLASRVRDYRSADLDELCTSGEVVWVGAGSVGVSDGRLRLVFRDRVRLLVPPLGSPVEGAVHDALRQRLSQGACFWGDLSAASQAAGLPYDTRTVLAALWDLVWNGEVTNDSLAPVRAWISNRGLASSGSRKPSRPVGARRGRAGLGGWPARRGSSRLGSSQFGSARLITSRRSRPRLGGLSVVGPPAAAGRWSLVEALLQPEPADTEIALARAHQLLDRYGVVTRQTALGEGQQGGFAGVYPVLKALEERGEVRRGYFVAGLGAAQFALPGAVDRLRSARTALDSLANDTKGEVMVLAATDPAQPYGASLQWPPSPGRPKRAVGAHVVLADGVPVVELTRGAKALVTFPLAAETDSWIEALCGLVREGRLLKLEISTVDGQPIGDTPIASRLHAAGFALGYKGLTWRS